MQAQKTRIPKKAHTVQFRRVLPDGRTEKVFLADGEGNEASEWPAQLVDDVRTHLPPGRYFAQFLAHDRKYAGKSTQFGVQGGSTARPQFEGEDEPADDHDAPEAGGWEMLQLVNREADRRAAREIEAQRLQIERERAWFEAQRSAERDRLVADQQAREAQWRREREEADARHARELQMLAMMLQGAPPAGGSSRARPADDDDDDDDGNGAPEWLPNLVSDIVTGVRRAWVPPPAKDDPEDDNRAAGEHGATDTPAEDG